MWHFGMSHHLSNHVCVQAAMRSQGDTVESVRLLSADLTAPPAQPQPASGGINIAAVAGGAAAGALVLATAIAAGICCCLRLRNARAEVEPAREPEYCAEPFFSGWGPYAFCKLWILGHASCCSKH